MEELIGKIGRMEGWKEGKEGKDGSVECFPQSSNLPIFHSLSRFTFHVSHRSRRRVRQWFAL